MSTKLTGHCVCGKISYTAEALAPIWYCHCEQCRRMTGHFMAASQVKLSNIDIKGEPKWFYVSALARYGFCRDCGSQMFWRNDDNDYMSVTGGSLDQTRSLSTRGHIYTCEKGAYYKLSDDEPQFTHAWN